MKLAEKLHNHSRKSKGTYKFYKITKTDGFKPSV